MKMSDVAIRNPVFTWMMMAALIIFGTLCFTRLGVSLLPNVDAPVINVDVSLEGAAPEVMETTVVDPLEDALIAINGIVGLSSTAKNGSASITLEFDLKKDIDVAFQEVQAAFGRAQRRLPKQIDPPIITKSNPEDDPILWLGVTAKNMEPPAFMTFVRDTIRDKFTAVPGVSEVFMGGYVAPAMRVWVSSKKLGAYSLTIDDVLNTIQNESLELPSGRIETESKEFNVRTLGEATSAEEFGNLVIQRRGGSPNFSPIRLSDIAKVEDGLEDIRRRTRVMGEPAIGIGIRKQRGANSVAVGDAVKAKMEEIKAQLPENISIGVNNDGTRFIRESVEELNHTLLHAGILTALVCWFFLGSWSSTFNIILAIPTSILGSFIVLYFLGFTLNTFTLLGLTLAIGIVVDDAIMVLENIVRHRELGKSKIQAAFDGAREIGFAALAATVAIIAIFIPVTFMEGTIGRYFLEFGVTISVAVALSLFEALTLTPMRCSQFLSVGARRGKVGTRIEGFLDGVTRAYERVLPWILDNRVKTLTFALVFFGASLVLIKFLKREAFPPQDQANLRVRLTTPEGSSLDHTDAKSREIEALIAERPEVERYFCSVGGFGGGEVNSAMCFITLQQKNVRAKDPASNRVLSQQELAQVLRDQFREVKGVRAFVQDPSTSGFGGARGRSLPVEMSMRGPEWSKLAEYSEKMKTAMSETGILVDVDTNYRAGMPEIHVVPDREQARRFGVSYADISSSINALIGGVIAGQFSKGGRRYDVRVRLLPEERTNAEAIRDLFVRNNRGELIPLSNVVKIEERATLQSVTRDDRERSIQVFANLAPGVSQADAIERVKQIGADILPPGYRLVSSGSSKMLSDAFRGLLFALLLGVLVAYMILASQFNSFIDPITVLLALPFSVTGALIFLLLTGQSINVYSLIGLILLMGIVKKNSIMLVDFANQLRREGLDVRQAVLKACPIRLRPILMTSFATIAGAVPGALALGPGAESRIPMAVAVIGGVLVSTFLTLLVVPCFYSLVTGKGTLSKKESTIPVV